MEEHGLFSRRRSHPLRDRAVLFGTLLTLSVLLIFHPILDRDHTLTQLTPRAVSWIAIHIALVPLFALVIQCFFLLLENVDNLPAYIARGAALIWGILSIAYESAVGLVTGLFSLDEGFREANRLVVQQALTRYLYSPVFGLSALVIQVSGFIAVICTLWALYRCKAPSLALPFLLIGGLCIAQGHESPFGPLGYGTFLTGVLLVECLWQTDKGPPQRNRKAKNEGRG